MTQGLFVPANSHQHPEDHESVVKFGSCLRSPKNAETYGVLRHGLCRNGLIGVVSLAIGEEVVDDHSDNREEEDNQSPNDLVGYGAVGLEDLNCGTDGSAMRRTSKCNCRVLMSTHSRR